MGVSEETLRESFRAMDSDELLRRWATSSFTEIARPIARAEIETRGLEASDKAIKQLKSKDEEVAIAVTRRRRDIYLRFAISAASMSGLILYKVFGIVAALACIVLILGFFALRFVCRKVGTKAVE